MSIEPFVELLFPMSGESLPVDHGWPVFAAVSQVAPIVHERTDIVIGPVEGAIYMGKGRLKLERTSVLPVRVPASDVREVYRIAGKTLDVHGSTVRLGIPRTRMLRTCDELNARIVVIANRMEWLSFEEELRRQLDVLEVRATIVPGRRRILNFKRAQLVGFAVGLTELSEQDSLRIQERGLGGRRSMGAGYFRPGPLPQRSQASLADLGLEEETS